MRVAAEIVEFSQDPRVVGRLVAVGHREPEHKLFHANSLLMCCEDKVTKLLSLRIREKVKEGLLDDGVAVKEGVKSSVGCHSSSGFYKINYLCEF